MSWLFRRRPVGRFESKAPLAVSQVDSTTWETTAPLIFHSATGRIFDVPLGSTTDWASRPLVVAWLISNTTGAAGDVVHDHCYRVLCPAGEITYREADALLEEMLTALDREAAKAGRRRDRIPAPTRWLMWSAVRLASITTRPGGSQDAWRDLGRMCLIVPPGLLLSLPAIAVLPSMAVLWLSNRIAQRSADHRPSSTEETP